MKRITNYSLFSVIIILMVFSGPFVLYPQSKNIHLDRSISFKNIYNASTINNTSKLSITLLPTLFLPNEHLKKHYSTGYGLAVKTSYEIAGGIFVVGGLETMLSQFKMYDSFDERYFFEKTSHWYSLEVGMKVLSAGKYRIYWDFNISVMQIYHGTGSINTAIINNPDNAIGFNIGVGIETPINNNLTLEINPLFNIINSIDEGTTIGHFDSYFKIAMGLNYKF